MRIQHLGERDALPGEACIRVGLDSACVAQAQERVQHAAVGDVDLG